MEIIEQFLRSKTNNQEDCEDSIFISDHFAAVIDGVTSKSTKKYNNELPGKACSLLLKQALEELLPTSTAEQAVEFLTQKIHALYESMGLVEYLTINPVERAAASIIIYSKFHNEIWQVGDCQCLVDKTHYTNTKKIDVLASNIRSFYIASELKLGKTLHSMQLNDTGRDYILPILQRQVLFQNSFQKSEFTYGAIDGFNVPKDEIKVIKLSNPKAIVLASDGYPMLFETLAESEAYLNKIIKEDPLCYKIYKSTKGLKQGYSSFDDRAYLKLRIKAAN
ncbi:MAG: PP2C family serine/threonine-protein phosphatase [Bacteroidota bacterium]|nr:PP2C family serine/threonine-protein phosphatase [Bacteroidota bacterium]